MRQLDGLATVAPDLAVRLLVAPGFASAHPELASHFELVAANRATRFRAVRMLAEPLAVRRTIGDLDLVHHAGGTMPVWRRDGRPTLLTVHDVQYLHHPQYFSTARRAYLRHRVPRSVEAASVIAVPSNFVAGTLTESFGTEPQRICVVPHGYDPPVGHSIGDAEELRRRYGLGDRRVIVYPAITHPHKGHRLLVDLLAGPWADRDLVLVLLGVAGAADGDVTAAIAAHGLGDRVVRPGRVPAVDRDGLIVLAEALVFPSEYEGFGAPVLEAMALGTPVVCSDRAALPEVVGDAGIVLPPTVEAWADALAKVVAHRAELVERGHLRAARFTTAESGSALAAAYRAAGSGG